MAFREIPDQESSGSFKSFAAIGDKFAGVFVRYESKLSNFKNDDGSDRYENQ